MATGDVFMTEIRSRAESSSMIMAPLDNRVVEYGLEGARIVPKPAGNMLIDGNCLGVGFLKADKRDADDAAGLSVEIERDFGDQIKGAWEFIDALVDPGGNTDVVTIGLSTARFLWFACGCEV